MGAGEILWTEISKRLGFWQFVISSILPRPQYTATIIAQRNRDLSCVLIGYTVQYSRDSPVELKGQDSYPPRCAIDSFMVGTNVKNRKIAMYLWLNCVTVHGPVQLPTLLRQ